MPCYNGIKYIKQAVESVLAQSHGDWELLIGDDGSQDGTREYLATLTDSRVKVFYHDKNLGIFGNLNFLFSKASAEISQILCQDDFFINQDSISTIAHEWQKLPIEVAFIRTGHGADMRKPQHASLQRQFLPQLVTPQFSNLFFYFFGCIPGNLSNVSLRTAIVENHGWFRVDLPYAGDFEFWSRVGSRCQWGISREHVVNVRTHREQASFTLNKKGELLAQLCEVIERLYQSLVQQGYSPSKLKLIACTTYISMHRDSGIKRMILNGDMAYLILVHKYLDQASFALNGFAAWAIYFATFGGRFFRDTIAKAVLKSMAVKQNPISL